MSNTEIKENTTNRTDGLQNNNCCSSSDIGNGSGTKSPGRPLFLIIDGSSLLSTCYYATLPLDIKMQKSEEERAKLYGKLMHAKDGTFTNAVYGFSMTLASMLRDLAPDRLAIVFDQTRDTFRRKLYPQYKAQRKDTPAPLKEQFKLMQDILSESGAAVFVSDTFEADDLAGMLTEQNKEACRIRLYTKDRDYLQLVDDAYDVRCLMHTDAEKALDFRKRYGSIYYASDSLEMPAFYRTTVEHTADTVYGEYGVFPQNIIDLKAIEGDASDNIPGVKGVSSAAAPLIMEYGSLEGIYEAIDGCNGNTKQEKALSAFWKDSLEIKRSPLNALKNHRTDAFLSKDLATIRKDAEQMLDTGHCRVSGINRPKFNERMAALDIKAVRL